MGPGIGVRLSLEVRARHGAEAEGAVQGEALAAPADEVLLEGGLVREERSQGAGTAVVVAPLRGHADQIFKGGVARPRLGREELPRGRAEAGQHHDRRPGGPGDGRPARGQPLFQQRIELPRAPEQPTAPHVPEGAAAFPAHAVQSDRHGLARRVGRRATGGERLGQRPGAGAPLRIEVAELGNGLLDDFLPDSDRMDPAPVRVGLAILATRRVAAGQGASGLRDAARCRQRGRSALHGGFGRSSAARCVVTAATTPHFLAAMIDLRKSGYRCRQNAQVPSASTPLASTKAGRYPHAWTSQPNPLAPSVAPTRFAPL